MLRNKGGLNLEAVEATNNNINLDELKESKQRDKKLGIALREVFLCLCFVGMTMTVSYQMLDSDAFRYQYNLRNYLGAGDKNTAFLDVITKSFCLN